MLNKSGEELFEAFLSTVIRDALNLGKNNNNINAIGFFEDNRMSDEVVRKRIVKWSRNPKCLPFKMLKAFFCAYHYNRDEDYADRFKVFGYFMSFTDFGEEKTSTLFRQMCSNASHSYGDVFDYDRKTRRIYISNKYKDIVFSLEQMFMAE